MEKRFLIKWEIDEFAENPLEAIRKAIAAFPHENNTDSLATVFTVEEIDINSNKVIATHEIDLLDEDGLPISDNEEKIEPELRKSLLENGFTEPDPDVHIL